MRCHPILASMLATIAALVAWPPASAAPPTGSAEFPGACAADRREEEQAAASKIEDAKGKAARQRELKCIARTAGVARREGKTLILAKDTVRVEFKTVDSCEGSADCTSHSLYDFYPELGLYVVFNGYYEGQDFAVIDLKTGRQSRMPERPHVSPGKRWIVSVAAADAFGWNGIEIWSIEPTGLRRTFLFAPFEHALYEFRRWSGENRVAMTLDVARGKPIEAERVRSGESWRVWHASYPRIECGADGLSTPNGSGGTFTDEAPNIAVAGRTVARSGDTLRIRTRGGDRVTFTDGDCGGACTYRFSERLETNAVDIVSRRRPGQAAETIAIDEKTGARADLPGMPRFALDGRTFAVFSGNAVEVWTLDEAGFSRRTRHEDLGAYCYAGWNGLDHLML